MQKLWLAVVVLATGWCTGWVLQRHDIWYKHLDFWLLTISVAIGTIAAERIVRRRPKDTK